MKAFRGANLLFFVVGAAVVSIGAVWRYPDKGLRGFVDSGPDILINIGVSILAVGLVALIWEHLGNDPIQQSIDKLLGMTRLFGDSQKTGVVRIYNQRSEFQYDRMRDVIGEMRQAQTIDIMGRVLRNNWAASADAKAAFIDAARLGCTIRFLLLDPDGAAAKRRDDQEAGSVISDIRRTITELHKLNLELNDLGKRLSVRVVSDVDIAAQIVRIDNYAWVQPYLFHLSGSNTPSFEIRGSDSPLLKKYIGEFNAMWAIGKTIIPEPTGARVLPLVVTSPLPPTRSEETVDLVTPATVVRRGGRPGRGKPRLPRSSGRAPRQDA